jgi:hypothetical protein
MKKTEIPAKNPDLEKSDKSLPEDREITDTSEFQKVLI